MTPQFSARFAVSVTPSDVGSRVSLRRRVTGGFGDVVGVLESWENGVLSVRRRDGSLTEVLQVTLVAGKVVPMSAPPRRNRS
ncbi:hypothetical protein [Rhizohabitans arisaemae]|uniref:putative acetyltransferase n=1 Tax=Rhizohabitans arisaemae TaxID=2720610 RepID=UPI0024B1193B|nr:hypothetical protein [Rhizohabitans arisaemae]